MFPFAPISKNPIEQGIRQGFSDTSPGELPGGIPR
jgi:hypothetical protein